jgi:hypothetical protein
MKAATATPPTFGDGMPCASLASPSARTVSGCYFRIVTQIERRHRSQQLPNGILLA